MRRIISGIVIGIAVGVIAAYLWSSRHEWKISDTELNSFVSSGIPKHIVCSGATIDITAISLEMRKDGRISIAAEATSTYLLPLSDLAQASLPAPDTYAGKLMPSSVGTWMKGVKDKKIEVPIKISFTGRIIYDYESKCLFINQVDIERLEIANAAGALGLMAPGKMENWARTGIELGIPYVFSRYPICNLKTCKTLPGILLNHVNSVYVKDHHLIVGFGGN